MLLQMPVAANLSGQLQSTRRKHVAVHLNQSVINEQCIVVEQAHGTAACRFVRATSGRAAMARDTVKGAQEADDGSDEKDDVPTTSTETSRRCVSTQSTPLVMCDTPLRLRLAALTCKSYCKSCC